MKSFVLSVANIKFGIHLLHAEALYKHLIEKYRLFICPAHAPNNVDVKLYFLVSPRYSNKGRVANNITFEEEKDVIFFRLSPNRYCGKYDISNKEGYFIIPPRKEFFNTILRIILAAVNNKKILLLHAASVVENKKGILLIGLPETGKTTISKKYSPENVLSDELSILLYENNKYYLCSSPFHSGEVKPAKLHTKVELCKIYLLSRHNLEKTEIVNYVLKNAIFSSKESYTGNLKHVKKILSKFSPSVADIKSFFQYRETGVKK